MTQGVGANHCEDCRRTFGGEFGFRIHRVDGRCLSARELRKRGFERRSDGTWVRRYSPQEPHQGRLFHQGRPRRRKSPEPRRQPNPAIKEGVLDGS